MKPGEYDSLDAKATLAAAERKVRARRNREVEQLLLLLRWCDLRSVDPQCQPGAIPVKYGGERLVDVAATGPPWWPSSPSTSTPSPVRPTCCR